MHYTIFLQIIINIIDRNNNLLETIQFSGYRIISGANCWKKTFLGPIRPTSDRSFFRSSGIIFEISLIDVMQGRNINDDVDLVRNRWLSMSRRYSVSWSYCPKYFVLCSKYALKLLYKNVTRPTYNYYSRRVCISQNIRVQRLLLHGCFN